TGLAAAARAGEQVRMVEPAAAQRLHQRLGDVLLPDDLGERARPVLAVQRQCHAYKLPFGCDRAPRAPVRARLSLLPSGPGEVHRVYAARGAPATVPARVGVPGLGILIGGGFA